MKNILLLMGALLINLNAISQQNSKAVIEFEKTTIDYGTIEKGADGKKIFKFTNTGNIPLIISQVKASCGCTIPKKPNKPILPGEKGEIEVKYDTRRVMPFKKTITVGSNAETPSVLLFIKGNVIDNSKTIIKKKENKSLIENHK
ncbi:MAG: DUF1573 domain-containing protein [Flavobacteriaceae bacterium]|jgi:hypothetical protein|nr:DUF1573 domain-containing protein [Flavobacteriaceae bacterium]